MSLSQLDIRR